MKFIEELKLKEAIEKINKYKDEHRSMKFFYGDLDNLKLPSLQNFSFKKDDEFFDEVNFILSVITSIINHPNLSNKREEIIVRSELAGHIAPDVFQEILKNHKLWKEKNAEMVPEYVHYYQYTDDIKIYENIFIGILINFIELELTKYNRFYISLIPSIRLNTDKYLENKIAEKMLNQIESLQRKLTFIKNTYFYKEISTCNLSFTKKILPTNILLKNRLYNYCYKFYLKFIRCEEDDTLIKKLAIYYRYTLLKLFKEKNFLLDGTKSQKYDHLFFKYNDYKFSLSFDKKPLCLCLNIEYKDAHINHKLIINTESTLPDTVNLSDEDSTVNLITTWHLFDIENIDKPLNNKLVSEKKLISYWLDSKLKEITAKKELYTKYCPVCKSKNIEENQNIYKCPNCKSIYTFKDDGDTIWFLKLRREF